MLLFNIQTIHTSLLQVQKEFEQINQVLKQPRDPLTDLVINNLLEAYQYANKILASDIDFFSQEGIKEILAINNYVLCGADYKVWYNHHTHIQATHDRFYAMIVPFSKWYEKHIDKNPFKIAAEIYVGFLSAPQLFLEGNHRTASIIASSILLYRRQAPFVLNTENAVAFFNPSSEIKFTDKRLIDGILKLPKYKKRFRLFLEKYVCSEYSLDS